MKLLCLNLWGGRQNKLLFDYLEEQSKTVDIFCFQEVFDSTSAEKEHHGARLHLFEELGDALPEFIGLSAWGYDGWVDMKKVDFQVSEGQTIFVKKNLELTGHGQTYIHGDAKTIIAEDFKNEPKILEYCKLSIGKKELMVANAHGMWPPGDKTDTPERLEQSRAIKAVVNKHQGPKILCGDFNLDLNTQSIAMFEPELRNLIKDYKITNTRNEISWNKYNNKQCFADFVFTSPDVKVNNFEVPYNLVSDHLPMILDFEL